MAKLTMTDLEPEVRSLIEAATPDRQKEALQLLEMMSTITGEPPKAWGGGIVGFGSYHYKYESGREGDWLLTGFSIRKNNLSIYVIAGFDKYQNIMQRLGKYKTGRSCLYVKNLSDVDAELLEKLITSSVNQIRSV